MNRAGHTLMELAVALTVTGLALSMGYASFTSMLDNGRRVEQATDEVARAAAKRRTLATLLEGARAVTEQDAPRFLGQDGVYRGFDDDQLWFLTTARTPLGTGEAIVHVYVDRDPTTPGEGLVATFSEWRGERTSLIEVDSSVRWLDIRYLAGRAEGGQWVSDWASSTFLPFAVEIRLDGARGSDLDALLDLPLVVTPMGGEVMLER